MRISLIFRNKIILIVTGLLLLTSSSVLAQGATVNEKIDYHRGLRLYEEGLFEASAQHLKLYVATTPDKTLSESAWYYLAKAKAGADSINTVRYYEEFVHRYPTTEWSADFLIELGHRYRVNGDFILAIDYFERAFEIDLPQAKAAPLLFWTAELYINIDDYDTARAKYLLLSELYRTHELSPSALYARGRLYLEQGQFAETTAAFELLRERHPFSPITRRIGTALGESYFQQGRYDQAITSLRNALPTLEDADLQSKAVLLIAESHNFLNQLDDASEWYLRFVNQNKGNPNERLAHYGLGWVYHKQQIYHWAAQSFSKAITLDDDMSRKALYYKAVNEKLSGRYDLALQSFQEFGNRYTEGFWVEEAYYEWAIVTFEIGDHVSTVTILLDLIRSGARLNNAGQIYSLLGEAYFANNEFGRAVDAFEVAEQMTDIDPAVKLQARFQRGWVLFQNHAFDAAQPIFAGVHSENPDGRLAAEAMFWNADSYYNMEEYGEAATIFEQFLRRYPNHELAGAAKYSIGWSYFRMGEFAQAVDPLREFLEEYKAPPIALFPYDVDTRLRLGDSYYALKQYREAMRYYEQAISSPDGGDYALFQVANSYYRSDQTYEAVQAFRRLLRTYPESRLREQSMYNIGYIYFLAGNFSQAITEFRRISSQFRGSSWAARAQYNIGDAHYNAGEYAQAIEAYQAVMKDYPRSSLIIEAVNGIQYAMIAAGEADRSSELLEDFLRENPQAGTADRLRFRQAEFLLRTADYAGAVEAFRDYIRVTNSTQLLPEAWYNLADAYRQMNDIDNSELAYQTLVNDYSQSARAESALLNLGGIAFDEGDYDKALEYFTQLRSRTNRLRNEANIGLGDTYLALNRLDESQAAYNRALQQNPNFEPGQLGLAKVKLRKGAYDEAMVELQVIVDKNTLEMGAEAQYWIGYIHQQQERFDEALQSFSQVRVLYEAYENWVSMSYIRTAEILRTRGETSEARATYQLVVDRFPGTEAARLANRVLQGN